MANYWEKRVEMQSDWDRYTCTPVNTRLKYTAMAFIFVAAIQMMTLFILLAVYGEHTSDFTKIVLRISAGSSASIGAVLYIILAYRVYSAAIHDRWTKNK